MSDLISRQDAIDVVTKILDDYKIGALMAVDANIKALPDAQRTEVVTIARNCYGINKKIFSDRLKECMKRKGISRQELADKLFLTKDSVNAWCSKKKSILPTTGNIIKLCNLLDCDFDYLIGRINITKRTIGCKMEVEHE